MKTAERARGKWRGILLSLGVDERFLGRKHGPCPFCEGRDRFRFDDKDGKGTFYCSHCGPGDGVEFVKRHKGCDFKNAVRAIDEVVGGVSASPQRPKIDPQRRREMLARLWKSGIALSSDDPVCAYLASRNAVPDQRPDCLRYVERCPLPYGEGFGPAMIALVVDPDNAPKNIHRTFLVDPAPGEKRQRAMMPGDVPHGSSVRLMPPVDGRLGIAEGIETAIVASRRFGVPTWAALNSGGLERWVPPQGVTEVWVFGDCDPAFGGQAAAHALAHRLVTRSKLKVVVEIPSAFGLDWADGDAV